MYYVLNYTRMSSKITSGRAFHLTCDIIRSDIMRHMLTCNISDLAMLSLVFTRVDIGQKQTVIVRNDDLEYI